MSIYTTACEPDEPTPNAALTKEGDWITHDGGPNPVPGQRVDFKIRVEQKAVAMSSDKLRWHHWGHSDDIIAYRLATPSPAAQDGTAKGLEERSRVAADKFMKVNADLIAAKDMGAGERRDLRNSIALHLRNFALTDHATATRQLAERDARVSQWIRNTDTAHRLYSEERTARLAAEADAARVREVLSEAKTTLAMLKRNVTTEIAKHDGLFRWEGVPEAIQARLDAIDAAQTQRGA